MYKDKQIFDIIAREDARQHMGMELIASENFVSPQVLAAMGSALPINMPRAIPESVIMAVVRWWTKRKSWLLTASRSSLARNGQMFSPIPALKPIWLQLWLV